MHTCLPPPPRRQLLPGQMRYGEYFFTLLHKGEELPPTACQPLLLRRIVCSKLGCFVSGGGEAGE